MADSYVETLIPFLKGKKIEVYTGSSSKDREYSDHTIQYKEVIRGRFIDAIGDLLMIEISDVEGRTNIVYVNSWVIVAIIEPKNKLSMFDAYCDESEKQEK